MNEKQIFKVILEKHDKYEATGITIPFDVEQVFGAKRVPVRGTINGRAEFRSTLSKMHGRYLMPVNRELRESADVQAGETITVEIERDTAPRIVEPPADLAQALSENSEAKAVWDNLSYTHKKEFAAAIEDAKKPETRVRRVQKTIQELVRKTS